MSELVQCKICKRYVIEPNCPKHINSKIHQIAVRRNKIKEKVGMKDKIQKIIDVGAMTIPCGLAMDTVIKFKDITVEEGLKQEPFNIEWWSEWILRNMGEYFTEEVRIGFIQNIKNEMTAFQMYLDREDLTDNEDKELKLIFEGKIPTAEKELRDGTVFRAKS